MLKLIGKCPETIFIGIIPKDSETESDSLTPEVEKKIPVVIEMVLNEVKS
jgi:Ni,Fe-hydrogenase maturation factor